MPNLLIVAICLVAILLAIIAVRRIRLKKESKQLSAKIRCIPSYESSRINEERRFAISTCNERFFADIDKGLIDLRALVLHGVPLAGVGVTRSQTGAMPKPLEGLPPLAGVQYFAAGSDMSVIIFRHGFEHTIIARLLALLRHPNPRPAFHSAPASISSPDLPSRSGIHFNA